MWSINWVRILRLAAGAAAVYQAIAAHNTVLGIIGAILLVQGIFNIGCCGTACSTTMLHSKTAPVRGEIKFEEVK